MYVDGQYPYVCVILDAQTCTHTMYTIIINKIFILTCSHCLSFSVICLDPVVALGSQHKIREQIFKVLLLFATPGLISLFLHS